MFPLNHFGHERKETRRANRKIRWVFFYYESDQDDNEVNINEVAKPPDPVLPKNYEAILQDADSPIDMANKVELYENLCAGVFLNGKRKRYWIERESNKHCVMLLARDLSIDWVEDQRYWKWKQEPIEPASDVKVDVAELLDVCWLEVHGKMDTRKLSQGTSYEVFLVVFIKHSAYGWEFPVTVKLLQPNGKKKEDTVSFKEKERGKWIEIPIGKFTASPENKGEIEVCMLGSDGSQWKSGLIIKGVLIRSKK